MQQTLFVIPHWLLAGPLLIVWLVAGALLAVLLGWRQGWRQMASGFLPVYGVVAAVIYLVLPRLEVLGIDAADPAGPLVPVGLAIRGYGLFLLTAILAGVGLTIARGRRCQLGPDVIVQLAIWMLLAGIAGARAFYVIQKSDEFFSDGVSATTLLRMVDMTKGGLVVYGSLIGGALGGWIFLKRQRLPVLATADLIAPGMALGLAIGRLGCLMNGCCFGGVCEAPYPGITFPAGSPPYMRQLEEGQLWGLQGHPVQVGSEQWLEVDAVSPESSAANLGIEAGDRLRISLVNGDYLRFLQEHPENETIRSFSLPILSDRQGELRLPFPDLPARSRLTHPTQIYSAINAFLLSLVLWTFWPLRRADGQVFALMLILYAVGRFLMELVRQDEAGQFGTSLTISQWVSMVMIVLGFALWMVARPPAPGTAVET